MGRWVFLAVVLGGCNLAFGIDVRPVPDALPDQGTGLWDTVASGTLHSCAIRRDGTLWCWGEHALGETGLGDTAPAEVVEPRQVGSATWRLVAAGLAHTCGLDPDGALWCWGYNASGQVGDGTQLNRFSPMPIGSEHWLAVAAGNYHTCAIREDHSLWCWGANEVGELGDGTTGPRAQPSLVDSARSWSAVTAGSDHTCAIANGELYCWGGNATGELGTPGVPSAPMPLQVAGAWTAVAALGGATCAITGGQVQCWGDNSAGALGDGTLLPHSTPAPIAVTGASWTSLAGRTATVCARADDGAVACWGENRRGQLGLDVADPLQLAPRAIDRPMPHWRSVAPGGDHTCAVDANRDLWCTGSQANGAAGTGVGGSATSPVRVAGTWTAIAAGATQACGIKDAHVWCWGDNGLGQLGENTFIARQTPVLTMANTTAVPGVLATGDHHACGQNANGGMSCWGGDEFGQLGDGGTTASARPVPVPNHTWSVVTASDHTCAIADDAHAYCFGRNTSGQLGVGDAAATTAVVKVTLQGSDLNWTQLAAGANHTCGVSVTHETFCWGNNTFGQLGTNNTNAAYFPVRVFGSPLFLGFAAGDRHTCAIQQTPQDLYCWGNNDTGQLGDGSTTMRLAPAHIGAAQWATVSAGGDHTCAIKQSDRTLWCWGDNARGQLGTGDRVPAHAPIQVGSGTWASVSASNYYTCGRQLDGSAWCWGYAAYGNLGDGTAWIVNYQRIGP